MSLCKYPINNKDAGGIVPCGQCLPCRINKRKKKTTRLSLEGQLHEHTAFVTLTYMDAFLPVDLYHPRTGEVSHSHPLGCLDKLAIAKFMKRLKSNVRRHCGREMANGIRFFCAGEYGDDFGRPHYHLVIWGLPEKYWYFINLSWRDPRTKELMCDPDRITIEEPRSMWDVGQYCCSYMMKSLHREGAKELEGRPPEFQTSSMSIGAKSVPAIAQVFNKLSGSIYIETNNDIPRTLFMMGRQMPIDRYLREKILEALPHCEKIKLVSKEKFEEEMSALFTRARQNPKIPKAWLDPFDKRRRGWALEMQYKAEQAQAVLNVEKRHNFKSSK